MGYQNVYWYREGITGWKKAGYPVAYTFKLSVECGRGVAPRELAEIIRSGKKVFLVDLRNAETIRKTGIITGPTVYYPLYRFHNLYQELPKNRTLVLYDLKGKQSLTACRYLITRGYGLKHLKWLKGGIEAWKKEKYPVE